MATRVDQHNMPCTDNPNGHCRRHLPDSGILKYAAALNVRTATEADLDQICAVADEVAALHHSHVPEIFAAPDTMRDREFWWSWITQTQSTIHVATDQETVVGFITAKVTQGTVATVLKPRIFCRIGTIVVASSARRQGVGTALMRSIEEWAIGQSAVETRLEVFDFNQEALAFYEELGYGVQSHIMRRRLK